MKCAGGGGPGAGGGPAASKVPVCCGSFYWESFFGTARGPISLGGSGALCYCDAGEDLHAVRQNKRVELIKIRLSRFYCERGATLKNKKQKTISIRSHHGIADTVVPVCIAISRSSYVTIVGTNPIVEGVRGVMMPTLGFKRSLFTIPRAQRVSLAL